MRYRWLVLIACLALAGVASFRVAAAQPNRTEPIPLPLGERVNVVHSGVGSQLTGQLVAQDRDWLILKVGRSTMWINRTQVVYVQHPAPEVSAPPPAAR